MIIEMDFRESYFILDKDLISHWESPHDRETISDDDKKRILMNIKEYLIGKNSIK